MRFLLSTGGIQKQNGAAPEWLGCYGAVSVAFLMLWTAGLLKSTMSCSTLSEAPLTESHCYLGRSAGDQFFFFYWLWNNEDFVFKIRRLAFFFFFVRRWKVKSLCSWTNIGWTENQNEEESKGKSHLLAAPCMTCWQDYPVSVRSMIFFFFFNPWSRYFLLECAWSWFIAIGKVWQDDFIIPFPVLKIINIIGTEHEVRGHRG